MASAPVVLVVIARSAKAAARVAMLPVKAAGALTSPAKAAHVLSSNPVANFNRAATSSLVVNSSPVASSSPVAISLPVRALPVVTSSRVKAVGVVVTTARLARRVTVSSVPHAPLAIVPLAPNGVVTATPARQPALVLPRNAMASVANSSPVVNFNHVASSAPVPVRTASPAVQKVAPAVFAPRPSRLHNATAPRPSVLASPLAHAATKYRVIAGWPVDVLC